ncbi:uncharacterized protein LOC144208626 isoform X2 [Stigmatopora nigra]
MSHQSAATVVLGSNPSACKGLCNYYSGLNAQVLSMTWRQNNILLPNPVEWCVSGVVAQWLSHQSSTSLVVGSNPSACKDFPTIIQGGGPVVKSSVSHTCGCWFKSHSMQRFSHNCSDYLVW